MKRGMGLLRVTVLAFGLIGPMTARADVDELNRQVVQLYQQGRYGEAVPVAQQAVAEAEANFGPDHASTATSLNNLAGLYRAMGRYDEALPLSRRALAIDEKALGADHPDTAGSLNNLVGLYRAMGPGSRKYRGEPEQLGRVGQGAGPLRRGLAAVPAGPGDP